MERKNARIRRISARSAFFALSTVGPLQLASGFHLQSPRLLSRVNQFHRLSDEVSASSVRAFRSKALRLSDQTIEPVASLRTNVIQEDVPKTMSQAIKTFFFSGDYGPLWVVLSICGFSLWRLQCIGSPVSSVSFIDGSFGLGAIDLILFIGTIGFWSLQEHVLHQRFLHSRQEWFGKTIHREHHQKPYYHISIDPAWLLLSWMGFAHLCFRTILPLPLALTATIAYSIAGLFYEWAHYIVHTRVRLESPFWKRVKENHLRHHALSDDYWFAFSSPWMDDLFHTNPRVQDVKKRIVEEQRATTL